MGALFLHGLVVWSVCMVALLVLLGCAAEVSAIKPLRVVVDPPYLVERRCDFGMLRTSKRLLCSEELAKRAPVWGRE